MIIDCISDLHGFLPELEGGDLLLVAGDLTAHDSVIEHQKFVEWLSEQPYRKKVYIAGNHDGHYQRPLENYPIYPDCHYLEDCGIEFEGLKIWGSPWSLWFKGIHPRCKAFTGTESDLKKKYELIPEETDILITHGPPYGTMDVVRSFHTGKAEHVGSTILAGTLNTLKNLKLHCFGHIHEGYGKSKDSRSVNASYVDEQYMPVNKPIRIEL